MRRGDMNLSGCGCRCVVVVQDNLPLGEFPLASTQYRRAAGTPDREMQRDPSGRLCQ